MREALGKVFLAADNRAAQALVLEQVQRFAQAARQNPALAAHGLWLVVASNTQRDHWLRVLAQGATGGALLGVRVLTLFSLAREIVQAAEGPLPPRIGPWPGLLSARFAALEPALKGLARFEDALGLVGGTVEDFLDAGLSESIAEEALEAARVADETESPATAEALVGVALSVQQALAMMEVDRPGGLLALAAEALENQPGLLSADALWLVGFEDGTAVAGDLISALIRLGAGMVLTEPPGEGQRYRAVFLETVLKSAGMTKPAVARADAPPWRVFRAADPEEEIITLAGRVRALLDEGVPPEDIGVVHRQLPGVADFFRRWFTAFGVPFSGGLAPPVLFAGHRRFLSAMQVLKLGGQCPMHHWLSALSPDSPLSAHTSDLSLALSQLGAATLADVANLRWPQGLSQEKGFRLQTRRAAVAARPAEDTGEDPDEDDIENGDEHDEAPARQPSLHRYLSHDVFRQATAVARHLLKLWGAAQGGQDLPVTQAARLGKMLREGLWWSPGSDTEGLEKVWTALAALSPEDKAEMLLNFQEMVLLLQDAAATTGAEPLGGAGGGVRVLDVTAARGLTFEHLFVAGLNHGIFPREVREDPLFSEGARETLRAVLPALPVKSLGHDEERFLFESLRFSAGNVTLSCAQKNLSGKDMAPSPLLQRLLLGESLKMESTMPLSAEQPLGLSAPRALSQARDEAFRQAVFTGLAKGAPSPRDLALSRLAALEEMETSWRAPNARSYGAFAGWAGETGLTEIFVTTLEKWARCPWAAFVQKVLHLQPLPDPTGGLPSLSARLLGVVVHEALCRLTGSEMKTRDTLAETLKANLRVVDRPSAGDINTALKDAADFCAREEGFYSPGISAILARAAQPYVEKAVALDWPEGQDSLVVGGAEWAGWVSLPGGEGAGRVGFMVDRLDAPEGNLESLRLTDFKTGKPFYLKDVKPETVQKHFRTDVLSGLKLQAVVYAAALPGAAGRYLFLSPDAPPEKTSLEVPHGDPLVRQAMAETVAPLVMAMKAGIFYPRFWETPGHEKPNSACRVCEVSETCPRHETVFRQRMEQVLEGDGPPADVHWQRLWPLVFLGKSAEQKPGGDEETAP